MWKGLSRDEQLRFHRHLERRWSINRHRMAPQVARTVDELLGAGALFVHAGEVETVSDVDGSLRLQVRLRSPGGPYTWGTDWLVNCTGTDPNLFGRGLTLMDALMARGLAHPGPTGAGVATDDRGRALDAGGRASAWLWAVGPLRQGELLESTAVPEIGPGPPPGRRRRALLACATGYGPGLPGATPAGADRPSPEGSCSGGRGAQEASVASSVISGTLASALLTGHPALAAWGMLDEGGLVQTGDPAHGDQGDGGDGGGTVDGPQGDCGVGAHRDGRVTRLGQRVGEGHRETRGMSGGDQLLRVGPRAVLEA